MMDVTGELPGAISSSPKDIGAGWADNGRAGVLSDHQMVKVAAPFSSVRGKSASMKKGVPYTCNALSTAIERPAVSDIKPRMS
jgi:hypothetical protein